MSRESLKEMHKAALVGIEKAGASARRPARLAEVVTMSVLEQIVAGDIQVGAMLPCEADLEETYGVSRTVIREAIKSLELKGVVRARQGLGTAVCSVDNWNLLDPAVLALSVKHDDDLKRQDELAQIRMALEGIMCARAAELASDQALGLLKALLDRMEGELSDPAEYLNVDFEYHVEIMRISGNSLGRSIVQTVHSQIRAQASWPPGYCEQDELLKTHSEHIAIYDAIASHDSESAQRAIVEHIWESWNRRRALLG